jgi:hypothetical protein
MILHYTYMLASWRIQVIMNNRTMQKICKWFAVSTCPILLKMTREVLCYISYYNNASLCGIVSLLFHEWNVKSTSTGHGITTVCYLTYLTLQQPPPVSIAGVAWLLTSHVHVILVVVLQSKLGHLVFAWVGNEYILQNDRVRYKMMRCNK